MTENGRQVTQKKIIKETPKSVSEEAQRSFGSDAPVDVDAENYVVSFEVNGLSLIVTRQVTFPEKSATRRFT